MSGHLGSSAKHVLGLLGQAVDAPVAIRLWTGETVAMKPGAGTDIVITVHSPRAFRRLLLKPSLLTFADLLAEGEVDLGEAHPLRMLRSVDHTTLMAGVASISRLKLAKAALPFLFARLPGKPNEIASAGGGARDDKAFVSFHYDLSNAFYGLFLGEAMIYSSGYFRSTGETLDQAQANKIDHICRKLLLKPGERLFETGSGWGALLCHAAMEYGVVAHGVTLSKEQFDFCQAKIAQLGLEGRVTVELRDMRSLETAEAYDKIAQVGMFEHVGLDHHDAYFRQIRKLLRPRGLYLHDAATRRVTKDVARFREKSVYQKFADRYIFPGGEMDHVGLTLTNLERNGFEVHDVENMREHYQKTAEHWTDRLWANREKAAALVGWPRTRMWLFYLGLTVVAFDRLLLNDFQIVASRRVIGASGYPQSR